MNELCKCTIKSKIFFTKNFNMSGKQFEHSFTCHHCAHTWKYPSDSPECEFRRNVVSICAICGRSVTYFCVSIWTRNNSSNYCGNNFWFVDRFDSSLLRTIVARETRSRGRMLIFILNPDNSINDTSIDNMH